MSNSDAKWNTNESLLQSYRSIFISSESFLLAVGALFWAQSMIILLVISILSLLIIWFIWFPVVVSRHRIVDYYKYNMECIEVIDKPTTTKYVKDRKYRNQLNKVIGLKSNWRDTRIKLI
jgi:ABC-type bacteriocin/lantibiotic exporter with double-glycine peptidase domain